WILVFTAWNGIFMCNQKFDISVQSAVLLANLLAELLWPGSWLLGRGLILGLCMANIFTIDYFSETGVQYMRSWWTPRRSAFANAASLLFSCVALFWGLMQ